MRPTNFNTLPVEEKRTIIEAEIKEIEGKQTMVAIQKKYSTRKRS